MASKQKVSVGMVLFGLFGLSFFVSKSAFTLFYGLAVLFGLYQFEWRSFFKRSYLEIAIIFLYPLAIFLNLFSMGGFEHGAVNVLQKWTWPLVYFAVDYLQKNKPERIFFFKALGVSLFVACVYSLLIFLVGANFVFSTKLRVASFWDISRWGYFCAMAIIILLSLLIDKKALDGSQWKKILVLFFLCCFCLVINNSRAPMFGALIGIVVVLFMHRVSIKYYLGFLLAVVLLISSSAGLRARILSSFSIERKDGQIVSQNDSNAARLNMWKGTMDLYKQTPYFGVGFDYTKPAFEKFFATMKTVDAEYVSRISAGEFSYNDQHSSYLSVLLQLGGIFFVCLYSFFLLVLYHGRRDKIYMPALLCTGIIYIVYSGILSFEAIVIFGLSSFLITQPQKKTVKG